MELPYRSDHYPIIIYYDFEQYYTKRCTRYKLDKADWSNYQIHIKLPNIFNHATNNLTDILENILQVSKQYIPINNPNVNTKYNVLWWRESCMTALSNAKKQFRILKHINSRENIAKFNMLEAIRIREILDAKRTSWQEYLGKVSSTTPQKEV